MTQPFRLMSFNPLWQQEFEQSRSSILQATEGWLADVRHIGSTNLLDTVARPVIDMLGGLADMSGLNEASMLIEGLNYRREPTPKWCDDELCAMLLKPRSAAATHTILLVRHEGEIWRRCMAIQQRLTKHMNECQELRQIKMDNFKSGCSMEQQYESAKSAFFSELEMRMEADC